MEEIARAVTSPQEVLKDTFKKKRLLRKVGQRLLLVSQIHKRSSRRSPERYKEKRLGPHRERGNREKN